MDIFQRKDINFLERALTTERRLRNAEQRIKSLLASPT